MALAVVDASVVAKWYLEENFSDQARRLRDDFLEGILTLRAPSVLPFEVMNALRYHPAFPRRHLADAAKALDRSGLITVPLVGEYLARTVDRSVKSDLTVYDASYVTLAEIGGCPLYTADAGILRLKEEAVATVDIQDYDMGSRG